jgi:hypothetical protein
VIPSGLTCPRCELPLSSGLARLDDEMYVHAEGCPCQIDGCEGTNHARGYCNNHYARLLKHGNPLGGVVIETEDIEWMAETGESLEGAAARLGTTIKSLEAVLRRRGRADLVHALRGMEMAA